MDLKNEMAIVKMGLDLMAIEYRNWETCLKECPQLRDERHSLGYYVDLIKRELVKGGADEN